MKRDRYPGYIGLEYVRMVNEIVPDVDNLSETIMLRDLIAKAWAANR